MNTLKSDGYLLHIQAESKFVTILNTEIWLMKTGLQQTTFQLGVLLTDTSYFLRWLQEQTAIQLANYDK